MLSLLEGERLAKLKDKDFIKLYLKAGDIVFIDRGPRKMAMSFTVLKGSHQPFYLGSAVKIKVNGRTRWKKS